MRTIYAIGEVNDSMVENMAKEIDRLVAEKQKLITVKLSSEGGSAYDAMAIYALIRNTPVSVNVEAYGKVMSAAILILAAGDKRSADKDCIFMVHEGSVSSEGLNVKDLKRAIKQAGKEEVIWNQLLADRTGMYSGIWETLAKNSRYFSSEEALSWGLLTDIKAGK